MYSPSILAFDPAEPFAHFGDKRPSAHLIPLLSRYDHPCCTVVPEDENGWDELLVWLPSASEEQLDRLARALPEVENDFSADYLSKYTLLCWTTPDLSVHLNKWRMHTPFLNFHRMPGFGVTFFNKTSARYAAHYMGYSEAEAFVGGLQGAAISTGPNYNPGRQWDDDFLDAHEGLVDEPREGVVLVPCYPWSPNATAE